MYGAQNDLVFRASFRAISRRKVVYPMAQTIQPSPSTTLSPTDGASRRQATIASLLGEASFERIDWRFLIQEGVLVQLKIRRCRFSTRLDLEDLGVRIENAQVREKLSKWLVLGEKRLLPQPYMKALDRLESSARSALKERSFRTEIGAFVPSSAYVGWRETIGRIKEQYEALRDAIIHNHRALVRQVLEEYEVIAADIYQRLQQTHPEVLTETQEHFVTRYCDRLAAQIPTPERIRTSFDFKVLLMDGLPHLEPAPSEQRQRAGREQQPTTVEAARVQAQQREMQHSILEQDLRRHAKERVSAALDSFLSSVVSQLRTLTYNVCCDVLATLQRRNGESFAPQSVGQLSRLLESVQSLDFYGDTELEQMMAQIQQMIDQSPEQRQSSIGEIEQTLRAIATVTRSTLLDLEEEPRSARALAIADVPLSISVRQARAELGLDPTLPSLQPQSEARAQRAEMGRQGMVPLWEEMLAEEPTRGSRTV